MDKLDIKKKYRQCYSCKTGEFCIVFVPRIQFLMADGCGDPKNPQFRQCVEALFGAAYAIKFALKKKNAKGDYVVAPLEGLWWADTSLEFELNHKDRWHWTLMIAQPDFVTPEMVSEAQAALSAKKELPAIARLRIEAYEEGLACQVMHVGPYDTVPDTIKKMHAFIHAKGHHLRGKHHEVYMSDPRREEPQKLKTIVRHPIL